MELSGKARRPLPTLPDDFKERELDVLSARDRRVFRLRFGLGGEERHTQAAVGAEVGLTGERVRQIINKGLAVMRKERGPVRSQADREVLLSRRGVVRARWSYGLGPENVAKDGARVLTEFELTAITLRYGLDDGRQRSYAVIGEALGVPRERVRIGVHRALNKLRIAAEEHA